MTVDIHIILSLNPFSPYYSSGQITITNETTDDPTFKITLISLDQQHTSNAYINSSIRYNDDARDSVLIFYGIEDQDQNLYSDATNSSYMMTRTGPLILNKSFNAAADTFFSLNLEQYCSNNIIPTYIVSFWILGVNGTIVYDHDFNLQDVPIHNTI